MNRDEGDAPAAPRRVTIEDVARLAEVHKGTVSRALNASTRHQVNKDTIDRIERAAQRLGYAPNVLARGLRTNNSMTIGIVLPDITNPFFPPIIRGIERYVQPRGYTSLMVNTDGDQGVERAAIDSLVDRRVDGLIVASGNWDDTVLSDLHRSGVKVVLLNRDAGSIPYPLVTGDDASGVEAAVTHLVDLGHTELLHISGPANLSTSSARTQAFFAACRANPHVHGRVVEAASLSAEGGSRAFEDALRAAPFTAVVAGNDLIALGALRAIRAAGLRCPQDISVVGFNDMPFAEDLSPALTTVRVPTEAMGMRAAQLLLEGIESSDPRNEKVILPVSLVRRGSTAPALLPASTSA